MGNKPKKVGDVNNIVHSWLNTDVWKSMGKKTVVLLAETRDVRRGLEKFDIDESEFVKQANWWKNKHKEFNVIVFPFYAKPSGSVSSQQYSLEYVTDQINKISNFVGKKVTVGFMGHAGLRIGGHHFNKEAKEQEIGWQLDDLERHQTPSFYDPSSIRSSRAMKERQSDAKKVIFEWKSQSTIVDELSKISHNIEGVMIGACGIGSDYPYMLQDVSNKLGVPVYAQSGTAWGTGAIEEIGSEPYEKFFVVGRKDSGIKYTPYNDKPTFMLRSTASKEKFSVVHDYYKRTKSYVNFVDSTSYNSHVKHNKKLLVKTGLAKPHQLPAFYSDIPTVEDKIFNMISEQGASPLGF